MKKIITCVTVAAIAMTFASCKKDYSCTCTTTTSATGIPATTSKVSLGKQTKKDAESACNGKSSSASSGGVTVTISCKLD